MGENLDKREIIERVERTLSEFLDSKVEILDNGTKASFTEVAKAQINKNQTLYFSEKQDKAFFSKDDISLVSNVVTQLAFALERSELYARVANYATDLEKEVEMKTIELKTANDSLLDLLRNKEEVLHIINHQLNTPISVIKSTAGMVRDGIWGMQKFYDITLKEVMNMEIILKDFWEAQDSRDIRSKLKLKKDSFSDLIKAILEEKKLNERVSSGQVKIVPGVEFTQKSFIISMDRSEIEQVVSNYVENALFYTKQGEIHINCDDSRWNKIVFSVRDTGMGFSSEMLSKLFGKFIRSKSAELARPNGSGLGLYICRKIIEAHGGRVWAESPGEGMGATFYFELPTNA
jgi:K+-sensing histidine kinase KdpD